MHPSSPENEAWHRLEEAEQRYRVRDLEDLRSGRRTAAEINAANRITPSGGTIEWPEDLSCLEFSLEEGSGHAH